MKQDGRKADDGKSRLDLVVPGWLWAVGQVLAHGATKYGVRNWQHVEPERYHAAAMRHLLAYMSGETNDQETGLHHMAHLACSAMFLYWMDQGSLPVHRPCRCSKCTGESSVTLY